MIVEVGRRSTSTLIVQGDRTAQIQVKSSNQKVQVVQSASPIPVGGSVGGSEYSWSPPSAQQTWVVPHNLGFKPSVAVLDGEGNIVFASVKHLSNAVLQIEFAIPFLGTAVMS